MKLYNVLIGAFFLITSIGALGQSVIDSLETQLLEVKDTLQVDILNDLSFQYYYNSMSKSDSFALLAINKAIEIDYKKGLAFAYVNYAYTTSKLRTKKEAITLFNKAYQTAKSINHMKIMAQAKNGIGSTLLNLALYDSALHEYEAAYQSFYELKDSSGMSGALNNIGLVNNRIGNYNKGIEYYLKAYEINRLIGSTRKQIRNLVNIGLVYINNQEEHQAKKYFEDAQELVENTDYEKYKADVYNGLAMVTKKEGNYKEAEKYYLKAKTHATNANDRLGLAVILHNLSDLHYDLGMYSIALEESLQSLAMKKELNNPKSIVFSLSLISQIYASIGNGNQALIYANKSLAMAQKIKLKSRERVAYNNVAQAHYQLGNYKRAYENKLRYEHLQDSLFNETKAEQIAGMEVAFQTERKEREIALMNVQLASRTKEINTQKKISQLYLIGGGIMLGMLVLVFILYQRQAKLTAQLKQQNKIISKQHLEKETLLKEIHHRVKNNLQVISSLLNLQSRHLDDQKAKDAVKESRSRIKSMSLIHQRLYTDNDISTINMPQYLKELTDFLFATFKPGNKIQKNIDSENFQFDVDIAVPLGLIINELISNSLKHAFDTTDQGNIEVSLLSDKNNYILKISDDGKGLPTKGFLKSMGMQLVETLVEQINGDMNISTKNGTMFTISFSGK